MKSYSVSYSQIHFTTLLRELPFTISRYGKPIAIVNQYNVTVRSEDKGLKENKVTVKPDIDLDNINVKGSVGVDRFFHLCKHGMPKGLCKLGCK